MWARAMTCALAFALLAGFGSTADAAKKAKAAKAGASGGLVKLVGCPQRTVPFCVVMRGPNNATYVLNSASPPVPVGTVAIRLTGRVSGDIGICFGTNLKDIQWRPLRQRCPRP